MNQLTILLKKYSEFKNHMVDFLIESAFDDLQLVDIDYLKDYLMETQETQIEIPEKKILEYYDIFKLDVKFHFKEEFKNELIMNFESHLKTILEDDFFDDFLKNKNFLKFDKLEKLIKAYVDGGYWMDSEIGYFDFQTFVLSFIDDNYLIKLTF